MEINLKHTASLINNGAFVIPRNVRNVIGKYSQPGTPVKVVVNGVDLGEKFVDSDFRIRCGKPLADAIKDNSVVRAAIKENTIEITVKT